MKIWADRTESLVFQIFLLWVSHFFTEIFFFCCWISSLIACNTIFKIDIFLLVKLPNFISSERCLLFTNKTCKRLYYHINVNYQDQSSYFREEAPNGGYFILKLTEVTPFKEERSTIWTAVNFFSSKFVV